MAKDKRVPSFIANPKGELINGEVLEGEDGKLYVVEIISDDEVVFKELKLKGKEPSK